MRMSISRCDLPMPAQYRYVIVAFCTPSMGIIGYPVDLSNYKMSKNALFEKSIFVEKIHFFSTFWSGEKKGIRPENDER